MYQIREMMKIAKMNLEHYQGDSGSKKRIWLITSLESTRQLSGQKWKRSMPDTASYITHSLMKDGVPSENSEVGIKFVFESKVKNQNHDLYQHR